MIKIYISHEFTGNEQRNRERATAIAAQLAETYPDVLFINPLMAMAHMEQTDVAYETILAQCLELLSGCQAIYMASPNWTKSRGCTYEKNRAEHLQIPVLYSLKDVHEYLRLHDYNKG